MVRDLVGAGGAELPHFPPHILFSLVASRQRPERQAPAKIASGSDGEFVRLKIKDQWHCTSTTSTHWRISSRLEGGVHWEGRLVQGHLKIALRSLETVGAVTRARGWNADRGRARDHHPEPFDGDGLNRRDFF
jgi:hypothetical protein